MRGPGALLLMFGLLASAPTSATASAVELAFARHSDPVAVRDIAALRSIVEPKPVRVIDPYEGREVVFEALDFAAILDSVFTPSWREEEELLFRCSDGYQPTISVARLLAHRAWLAFRRVDQPNFSIQKLESGRVRDVELAPFYLVWENLDDELIRLEGDHGWPYQLIGVELIRARDRFPAMAPPGDSSAAVLAGFSAFRRHCSRCHAMNGEGGGIGPELNTPINPVEVRDSAWLRRWIDDPSRIRADARMPRLNPSLPERDATISNLLAYLEAISHSKLDSRPESNDGS
jgi:mono/diheme cytochrome c family protein